MQAGVPYSNGGGPLQVATPGAAVRQTPFAMADTSDSQPGTSDMSGGTHASDGSWQQRPSIQGMALQVRRVHAFAWFHCRKTRNAQDQGLRLLMNDMPSSLSASCSTWVVLDFQADATVFLWPIQA